MQSELTKKSGLNKWWLQLIAIVAMLADHAAVLSPVASVYYILKLIGRITIVIMCYFIAEGYHKTSSIPKYIMRMGIFAAISQIPYYLYIYHGRIPTNINGLLMSLFTYRNVIFTLFIVLVLLAIVNSGYKLFIKLVSCVAALYLVRSSDWGYYVILWIIGCGLFYGSKKNRLIWMSAIIALRIVLMTVAPVIGIIETRTLAYATLYNWLAQFGGFLAIPLLAMYNGEKGRDSKLSLYLFYPIHIIVIVLLWTLIY